MFMVMKLNIVNMEIDPWDHVDPQTDLQRFNVIPEFLLFIEINKLILIFRQKY